MSDADTTVELPSSPTSARFARDAVRDLLADEMFPARHEAELVTSELVTNAVLHGRPPVVMRVHRRRGVWQIEVCDGSPARPERRHPAVDEMGGRGLLIVEKLTSAWGSKPWRSGKCVWATFTHEQS